MQPRVAGLRRFGAASLDLASSLPDGSMAIGSATSSLGTSRRVFIMVREAGGVVSGIEGGDGNGFDRKYRCGNEFVQTANWSRCLSRSS